MLPEAPAAPEVVPAAAEKAERETIRASVARLDNLVNLLGEMLIVRRIFQERSRQLGVVTGRLEGFLRRLRRAENYALFKEILDDFSRLSLELERDTLNLTYLTEELHGEAMELRMLPLATITGDLVRMARGLARDQEKEIQLAIEGEDVELDRMMLEAAPADAAAHAAKCRRPRHRVPRGERRGWASPPRAGWSSRPVTKGGSSALRCGTTGEASTPRRFGRWLLPGGC